MAPCPWGIFTEIHGVEIFSEKQDALLIVHNNFILIQFLKEEGKKMVG